MRAINDHCVACGQPLTSHVVASRWVGCSRDVVIGNDQERAARRLRLALIQSPRAVKMFADARRADVR